MDTYIKLLMEQWSHTIPQTIKKQSKKEQQQFIEWLLKLHEAGKNYAALLDDYIYDTKDTTMIAETNKGQYDTIIPFLYEKGYSAIVVSPYTKSFLQEHSFQVYEGEFTVLNNIPIFQYPAQEQILSNPNLFKTCNNDIVDTVITQMPFTSEQQDAYSALALSDHNKTIIMGCYGSKTDIDRTQNIKTLQNIAEMIDLYSSKEVAFIYGTIHDSYYAMMKTTPKQKTKTLYR